MRNQRLETPDGYRLGRTFSIYRMGRYDPSLQLGGSTLRMALHTPEGDLSLSAAQDGRHVDVALYGPGAEWLEPRLPDLLGLRDDPGAFAPRDPAGRRVWKHSLGTHLPRLPTVFPRLARTILLQLVTTTEAHRAWQRIVKALGRPAPGPDGLIVPPSADDLSRVPWYRFVADGVPHRQARTLVRCARRADAIESAGHAGPAELARALLELPGVGPWTVAYVSGTALGDPDAVLTGDYNLPHTAAWLLAGKERGTDDDLLRLLEPYEGNRFRMIRALWAFGEKAPRRGPRRAPRPLPSDRD